MCVPVGMSQDATPQIGPAAAFNLVGEQTRVDILRLLLAEDDDTVAFSDLYHASDVDNSGRFNYHLQKLTGHFVEHRADGYRLNTQGRKVAHAVLAGTYNERPRMPPTPVEGECHECETATLVASYDGERLGITCETCDTQVARVPFPPAAVSTREPAKVPAAFDRWATRNAALVTGGVCPECGGTSVGRLEPNTCDVAADVVATFECAVCRHEVMTAVGTVAFHHPEVRTAHHRADAYPLDRPYWTTPQFVSDRHTEVRETDPYRVAVEFPLGEETVTATVDGTATVVDVETDADEQSDG